MADSEKNSWISFKDENAIITMPAWIFWIVVLNGAYVGIHRIIEDVAWVLERF